jgi:hypothetical protein
MVRSSSDFPPMSSNSFGEGWPTVLFTIPNIYPITIIINNSRNFLSFSNLNLGDKLKLTAELVLLLQTTPLHGYSESDIHNYAARQKRKAINLNEIRICLQNFNFYFLRRKTLTHSFPCNT